ncbi:MAG: 30S ribosomal protein S16 [Candidatus Zophobacter franzmannii]|nr:30S ribosomal protein S16 [Candidatus Zophobacter franzmannii]
MVKLRLKRMGARNAPFYRIVAVDARVKRDGKYLEAIGWYDPKPEPFKIQVDREIALKWLRTGAQPTETVRSLLRRAGVLEVWHKEKEANRTAPAEEQA